MSRCTSVPKGRDGGSFRHEKRPAHTASLSLVLFDPTSKSGKLFRELCLFICRIVLVQNSLGNGGIDSGNGLGIEGRRLLLIAGFHSDKELLDLRFEGRFDGFVFHGLLFCDKDTLFGGFDVGHDISPLDAFS